MRVLLLTIMPDPDVRIPLGLATLKAYAHQHSELLDGAAIDIEVFSPSNAATMAERIAAVNPDVVGYSTFIWNAAYVPYVIEMTRRVAPPARIILGGPSAGFRAAKLLERHADVDIVVHGEGEEAFNGILRHYLNGSPELAEIPGISYRAGSDIVRTAASPPMHDLDEIPSIYTSDLVPEFETSQADVMYATSRGCSQRCSYCLWDNVGRNTFKRFSMERVIDDLTYLIEEKTARIYFIDAFVNFKHGRTIQLFEFFLEHARSTQFLMEIYGDLLNDREIVLMNQLAEAGILARNVLGIQSIHAQVLRNVNRRLDLEAVTRNVAKFSPALKKVTSVDLIVGLPGDNHELYMESVKYIIEELGLITIQSNLLRLMPGTQLYQAASDYEFEFAEEQPHYVSSNSTYSKDALMKSVVFGRFLQILAFTYLHDAVLMLDRETDVGVIEIAKRFMGWLKANPPIEGDSDTLSYFQRFFADYCRDNGRADLVEPLADVLRSEYARAQYDAARMATFAQSVSKMVHTYAAHM